MRLLATSLALSALVFVGCASDVDVGGNTDGDLAEGGDWDISDEAHAKMMTFSLPYDGPDAKCAGGFTEGANQLARMVRSRFPNAVAQTLGYACRANTADPNSLSIHAMGRAVDVMMKDPAGKAGGDEAGKEVADFFLLNGDLLGVQYIIWNHTKCNLHLKSCGRYSGPNPHTDHIHVEITLEAAELKAPFYSGTALRDGTTSADPAEPVDPTNPDPVDPNNPDPVDPPDPSGRRECSADLDCGDSGMCSTVPQQGHYYCCVDSSSPGCQ